MITIEELEKEHNIRINLTASHVLGSKEYISLVMALAKALGVNFTIEVTANEQSTRDLLNSDA